MSIEKYNYTPKDIVNIIKIEIFPYLILVNLSNGMVFTEVTDIKWEGLVLNEKKGIIITGAIVGILATVLVKLGNPVNMGLCIVCFIRDTAGGLGLHRAGVVQYIRPEIIGMALGAFIIALISGDYHVRGVLLPLLVLSWEFLLL